MSPKPPAPIAPAIADELIIVTIVTVKPATIPGKASGKSTCQIIVYGYNPWLVLLQLSLDRLHVS